MHKNHLKHHMRHEPTAEKKEIEEAAQGALATFQRFFTTLKETYVPSWKGFTVIIAAAVAILIETTFLSISRNLAQQQAAPANQITNQAQVTYQDPSGNSYGPLMSNSVVVDVLPLPSPSPAPIGDTTAPEQIVSLAVDATTDTTLSVSWQAPGDDGAVGTASSYDLRVSDKEIKGSDKDSWDKAVPAPNEPTPLPAGTPQTYIFTGLTPNTTYWIALIASDEANNVSTLSNIVFATTTTIVPLPTPTIPPQLLTAVKVKIVAQYLKENTPVTLALKHYLNGTTVLQVSSITDKDGKAAFTINNVVKDVYDVAISIPGYLVPVIEDYNFILYDELKMELVVDDEAAGNLQEDGTIDSLDYAVLSSKWGASDATSDLNGDGIVNSIDFSIMNANWGKTNTTP